MPSQILENGVCISCLDSSCLECVVDRTNCISCRSPKIAFEGECISECPAGYHAAGDSCQECPVECQTCSSAAQCQTCTNPNLAAPDCTSTGCADNQYESAGSSCENCHSSCQTCSGPSSDNCLSCPSGFSLIQGQCKSQCPQSHYYQDASNSCQPCSANCLTCSSADTCTACSDGYLLIAGSCLSGCEELDT